MPSILASSAIAGAVLATAITGANVAITQDQADQGKEAAHVQNMTSDIQHCQADILSEAGFTRGLFAQASAATTAAHCAVTPGTVLTVRVSTDGRHFKLIATSEAVTHFDVAADTAAGGAVQVTEKAA